MGLPIEMAIHLFQPFLVSELMKQDTALNIIGAKKLIETQSPLIWRSLQIIMNDHPVLLNRAPTLHRLGIQAFQPKLIAGRAILLHPMVCTAFNADFDGDQMAVHVPLSKEACAESWALLWSRNQIMSPATGQPLMVPSQDMVLGCYYLTTYKNKIKALQSPNNSLWELNNKNNWPVIKNSSSTRGQSPLGPINSGSLSINQLDRINSNSNSLKPYFRSNIGKRFIFSNFQQVLLAFRLQKIQLHTILWVRSQLQSQNGVQSELPLEIRINIYGCTKDFREETQHLHSNLGQKTGYLIRTTPGRVLLHQAITESLSTRSFDTFKRTNTFF